jgi:hypothetical protein
MTLSTTFFVGNTTFREPDVFVIQSSDLFLRGAKKEAPLYLKMET